MRLNNSLDGGVYTGTFSNTTFQLVDAANFNSNATSVLQSFNCYTLTGLPSPIKAGTSNQPYTVRLTNLNGAGGPSISGLSVVASTPGVSATVAALSPAIAPVHIAT